MKILAINTFYLGLMGLFFIDNCFAQVLQINIENADKISALTCRTNQSYEGFEVSECNNKSLPLTDGACGSNCSTTAIDIQPKAGSETIKADISFEAINKKTNMPLTGKVDVMFSIYNNGAFSGIQCTPTDPEDEISCSWNLVTPGPLVIHINKNVH